MFDETCLHDTSVVFKVLHWPTFMLKYEATFTTAAQADPLWLGILNQVRLTRFLTVRGRS